MISRSHFCSRPLFWLILLTLMPQIVFAQTSSVADLAKNIKGLKSASAQALAITIRQLGGPAAAKLAEDTQNSKTVRVGQIKADIQKLDIPTILAQEIQQVKAAPPATTTSAPISDVGNAGSLTPANDAGSAEAQAEPAKHSKIDIVSLLRNIGIGLAALASVAALVFAILAWREAGRIQESIGQVAQRTDFNNLSADISRPILVEVRSLKTLNTDLERYSQNITTLIKNAVAQLQPIQHIVTSDNSSSISLDQAKTLALAAPTPREGAHLSTEDMAALRNLIAHSNRTIIDEVQNLKRQLDAQANPQTPSLSVILSQSAVPGDALTEAGQRLQDTCQKLGTGNRESDYFLDSVAQAVFVPLSVPLAPSYLSEAQMNYRVSLLGAIERTRAQAAANVRKAGLDIMPIELSKTHFDGNRHDAILGTEIRTDRAELNGKVAEVLRQGFLQKDKDNATKVLRKAQVRLFLKVQPKAQAPLTPTAPPVAASSTPATPPKAAAPIIAPVMESPAQLPVRSQEMEPVSAMTVAPASIAKASSEPASESTAEAISEPVIVATPIVVTELTAASEPKPIDAPEPENSAPVSPIPYATPQQQVEAWRGFSVDMLSQADWESLAETLTTFHREQGRDASALDTLLTSIFPDSSPRSIVPQIGEIANPHYEAQSPVNGGVVAEVLRVGVDNTRDGNTHKPVLPLVRLALNESK